MSTEFKPFPKMARLSRPCIIQEKIDGTNASIFIGEDGEFLVGSRTRWITPENDNFGFARWAYSNKEELMKLGPGHHFGECWGSGIQRGYGLKEKRFSLFNTSRWGDDSVRPKCCHVVPVLYSGIFNTGAANQCLIHLIESGSAASPGFMDPEGIVVFHEAGRVGFKKTIKDDEVPKSLVK
jgi:RNA ligase